MITPNPLIEMIPLVADPYERKARLAPALIVLMPLTVSFITACREELDAMRILAAVLVTFCAPFLFCSIVRFQGKQLEAKLVIRWGGLPSTILLRHRDARLNPQVKMRYHRAIRDKLGLPLPTAARERNDPRSADHAYEAAVAVLRDRSRGTESLVLKENISYGFFRNMSALRPFGIAACIAGLVVGLHMADVLTLNPVGVAWGALLHPGFEGGATLLISGMLLLLWVTSFSHSRVEGAAYAYAERLLSALDRVP
ncbi:MULTISPECIES: hypothetical protein [Stenotrophomonas]|uniref:hypothetical protein n=1 Tax=Stenotrophomonas TaxID=40323 RepID=UPI000ADB4010|nr:MULTISPECIES: hypothetical protein [Stenotrophomonas]